MFDPQNNIPLPFLTQSLAGTGGVIKSSWEDFIVEEVPIYTPSGSGTHIYALMENIGSAHDSYARARQYYEHALGAIAAGTALSDRTRREFAGIPQL